MRKPINIIFDGPPSEPSGRFVEVETDEGQSISIGEWIDRGDGLWALRITELPELRAEKRLDLLGEMIATFSIKQNQSTIEGLPEELKKLIKHWVARYKKVKGS